MSTDTKCDFSGKQLTLSVSCAGILYAHISLPRGEDIIEDELVSVAVDAFDGHDDLPVSAVLRLKVVEFQLTLVRLVDAAIDRVVLQDPKFVQKVHLMTIIPLDNLTLFEVKHWVLGASCAHF